VEHNNDNTAAVASTEDVADCTVRADAQVRSVLQRVMAQRRSVAVAFGYVVALSPGTKANCWSIAESAGHEGVPVHGRERRAELARRLLLAEP
jgi:hypothetical protein